MHPDDRLADELAHSASALRALARDLTGSSDADDLVQETMLRAWRNPPPERRGLRPWLATILRNLANNHHRDERRRRAREQDYDAQRSAQQPPGPHEPETLRAVTETLWQLPEPYQGTLTLRYFAGLSPTDIATRTRAPLPTVKSRLRRGLQLLRERLERERGSDWRTALCAATGLATTGSAAATTASLLLMAHTTKILFGTAAAVIATLLLWQVGETARPPSLEAKTDDARFEVGSLSSDHEQPQTDRVTAIPMATPDAVELDNPYRFELHCRVVDRDGLIVPHARVAIAPPDGQLNQWPERAGPDGIVTVHWRARVPEMTLQVGLMVFGSAEGLRRVQVRAGADNKVALLHAHGASTSFCMAAMQSASKDCTVCHTTGTSSNKLFDAFAPQSAELHPFAWFQARLLGDNGRRLPGIPPPPPPESYEETEETSTEMPPTTTVTGVVRDANGEPVANATVVWTRRTDVPIGRTKTDADGVYRFSTVSAGEVEVRAGGGADGLARRTLRITEESTTIADLFLQPGRSLSGNVHLPAAQAADAWRVEYVAHDTNWTDGAVLLGNSFRLANLPSQQGAMLLWSPHGRLPVAFEPNVFAGSGVIFDLTMQGLPSGTLRLEVPTEQGDGLGAMAYHVDSGRGAAMMRRKDAFHLDHLGPGWYRIALVGPQIGFFDLGQHFVDGTSTIDLGVQRLPEPSLLRIDREHDQRFELYRRHATFDVRAAPIEHGQLEFLLPAGDWLVIWGDRDAPRSRTITVRTKPATTDLR